MPARNIGDQIKERTQHGFLWEAEKNEKQLLLVGTLHFGYTELPASIADRIASIKQAFVEVVLSEPPSWFELTLTNYRVRRLLQRFAEERSEIMTADVDLVASRIAAAIHMVLGDSKNPDFRREQIEDRVSPLGPVAAALDIFSERLEKDIVTSSESLDKLIEDACRARHIPIKGLESYSSHVLLPERLHIDSVSELYNRIMQSDETVADWLGEMRNYLFEMCRAADTGDLAALEAQTNRAIRLGGSPDIDEMIERNHQFVNKIDSQPCWQSPLLVAIGASHFVGKSNVIDLLESKGWTVRRIVTDLLPLSDRNSRED